jgi:threonine/homoserine/homoserine lactone efflux protein
VAVGTWLAVWPALLTGSQRSTSLAIVGAAGVVTLAVGILAPLAPLVHGAIVILGGGYLLHLVLDDPPLDVRAALFAAALVTTSELAHWAIELRRDAAPEQGRLVRRLLHELGLGLGSLLLAGLVLAAAELDAGVAAIELIGLAAAAALLWFGVQLLRRPDGGSDHTV